MKSRLTKIPPSLIMTILLNGIAPYLIYIMLKEHTSGLTALLIATSVPFVEQFIYFAYKRVLDIFGMLMAGTFVLGAALALLGGSEEVVLLRESIVTATVGCVFLGSLFMKKPLIYHLSLRFIPTANAESLEQKWQHQYFRRICRLITAIWAILLLGEVVIRVWLIFELSISQFLIISQLLFYSTIAIAIALTIMLRRRMIKRLNT